MSVRTLPLVFINLGGEMLYILDQRLQAQNTSEDNSEKGVWSENDRRRVMNDIVGTMFNKAFMDELLKPQQLYSHRTLKTVLTRIAHASIMRLNPASMDRLYELMVMAFKYQVFLCPRPKDLLLISYNHIDTIREFVKDTPVVVNQVDETHRKIIEVYSSLSEGEFQLLRQTLLIFFQDMHVRVSLFLKIQVQNPNGRFALSTSGPVPHGTEVPGLIRTFDSKGREVRRSEFPTGGSYSSPIREGCFELHGDRIIRLGLNMYTVNHPEETHTSKAPSVKTDDTPNLLAKEELNLLARLMGSMKAENKPKAETGFRINLFTTDEEEEEAGASCGAEESLFGVINIQAMQDEQAATELARIAGQFAEQQEQPENPSGNKGDDLLAMMDDL
ncbi:protein OSCP1 isoform X1 [Lates calcarifer]|uniref:Protein OSCP1 isoform X1 n=1 Tax=Lates calcarifer TaxID=8187 RepID=A0AAJ7V898_LATCA|nr:protein OSCP1a isoform X1 [Lates calcarifer]XP_018540148.1 protein OSCP1 isoform X1 [Lates calcarifer]